MNRNRYFPIIAGFLTSFIFGFSFLFTKETLDKVEAFHLLALRFSFAAGLLVLLNIFGRIEVNLKGKKIASLLILGICQPILYFIFEILGLQLTTSSEAGMMMALIPVVVTLLAAFFLKEIPNGRQILFIAMSVLGVIIIVAMKGNADTNGSLVGIALLLGAVLSASFFNIVSRKSSLNFKPVELTYVMMIMGAVVFNLISILSHIRDGALNAYFLPLKNIEVLGAIIYLGILSSVVAFFLVNYMLSKMEASRSAVFANLTTIISVFAGVIFRGEVLNSSHIIGGMMIFLGVWGTNYFGERNDIFKIKE